MTDHSLTSRPDLSKLTQEETIRYAQNLRHQGITVLEISDHLGCCVKTVYNYLSKAREKRLTELESCKSIDVLVDNLESIENFSDMCLKMTSQIATEKHLDPITGEIIEKNGSLRDRAEILRLGRDFLKMKIDLELRTGVMPSSVDRAYQVLSEQATQDDGASDEGDQESRPELEKRVLDRMNKQIGL